MAEKPFEGGDASVADAARNDEVEIAEVGRHVESKAVARDPPRYPDADGRQLLASDPDAGQPPDPAGPDAKIRGRADEHLLEIANVTVDVAAVGLQIDDRIADDLAGTVVGDIAAPTGFVHMD